MIQMSVFFVCCNSDYLGFYFSNKGDRVREGDFSSFLLWEEKKKGKCKVFLIVNMLVVSSFLNTESILLLSPG